MTEVCVVFGGRSVEHEVSIRSARTVARALTDAGYSVSALGIAPDGCWIGADAALEVLNGSAPALTALGLPVGPTLRHLLAARADVYFPIVHGTGGEDGSLQGLFEMLDLPYVGAGVTASAVAMDKLLTKRILAAAELPVVDYEAVRRAEFGAMETACLTRLSRLDPPVFVKPSVGGSSVGVVRLENRQGLTEAVAATFRFDDTVLVEPAIEGRELECSVLGYGQLEASAVGEVVPSHRFYDYADKYLVEEARLLAPADLPPVLGETVRKLAVEAFAAIGGWGMARVDFLVDREDNVYINEINTLPGFTSISMYPRLWEASGLSLSDLVTRLVEIAGERFADRGRLGRAIADWLGALG